MTLQKETRRAGDAAGLGNTSCLAADGSEIAQNTAPTQDRIQRNPAAVAVAIKDLTIEYAVDAAHIASVSARHFVEDIEIGDMWSAEHDLRMAVLHLKEAAAKFREWQGKPLPTRVGAADELS
jgi:hypothetical protein